MRKIYLIFLLFTFLLACSEHQTLDVDIETMVSMPNNGFQKIDANNLKDGIYKISIYKAGYNNESVTAVLQIDEQILISYNNTNKSDYKLLPEKYYKLSHTIQLSKSVYQANLDIEFDTTNMILDNIDSKNYVVPLSLAEPKGKINTMANKIIINLDLTEN